MQGSSLVQAELQGAKLLGARLQLANLESAQLLAASLNQAKFQEASLDGATWSATDSNASSFENRVRRGIWRGNLLRRPHDAPYKAVFAGGLEQKDLDSLVEGLPDEKVKEFREKLKPHVGKPASHELPDGFTGAYTKEHAEQWIAEYNEAMSEVPEKSGN